MDQSHNRHCISCGATDLDIVWGVTSIFFAKRALNKFPEVVGQVVCRHCETRKFEIDLTEAHLQNLYLDYRGIDYFRERHGSEPWYTRVVNDGLSDDSHFSLRRQQLSQILSDAGLPDNFMSVLDHGGDRGQMLIDLNSKQKAVYDISGVTPVAGVINVSDKEMKSGRWDVILSCHVLEHFIDPQNYLQTLISIGQVGTIYVFEIPHEPMRYFDFNCRSFQRRWLSWLCRKPKLLNFFDFLSSGMRVKFGTIGPLLFPVLREHLTFFSIKGVNILLINNGFEILASRVMTTGHIGVVARRLAL